MDDREARVGLTEGRTGRRRGAQLTFETHSTRATEQAGERLAALVEAGDVIALAGDLGAGKTHLVQGVAAGLGVEEPVTSPTFTVLAVHPGGLPLYHFDLYRLEREEELDDVGFFETLEADGVSMIEWGDRFPAALPADHLLVAVYRIGDESRRFELAPCGPRSTALAEAWLAAEEAAR